MHSCLHNLRLKLLSKLSCANETTNVYACMITCDRISTRSLIVLSIFFIQFFFYFHQNPFNLSSVLRNLYTLDAILLQILPFFLMILMVKIFYVHRFSFRYYHYRILFRGTLWYDKLDENCFECYFDFECNYENYVLFVSFTVFILSRSNYPKIRSIWTKFVKF